jgi:putative transposase
VRLDLCRRHGVSDAAFYRWRSKYGGMEVSEARKLKGLEGSANRGRRPRKLPNNAKLKKLLAESMLDVSTLREMLARNF